VGTQYDEAMTTKLKIILVDDSDQKRATYLDKFKSEGFEVLEAIDGKKGLEAIKAKKPDLIFTGIDMPTMDGWAMIRELKKNPELSKIPIMISSHMNRKADQITAKELGVQEFIYYGFVTVNEVVQKARNLLGEKK